MNYEDIIGEIKGVLDLIRPYINRDGGDVEFVKFEDGIVYVRLTGACVGCAAVDSTMNDLIEDTLLERVPGVIGVELVA
ncbi:MAG: NifU family protein [Candidatus Izemoplasmatales bacterium]